LQVDEKNTPVAMETTPLLLRRMLDIVIGYVYIDSPNMPFAGRRKSFLKSFSRIFGT